MRIFLSWSGHSSYQVADVLREWLPAVLPYARPWVSAEDIDKGARWANEIAIELSRSNFGIICIVPGNVNQAWLNFEAGAISKTLDVGRVAPVLVGVDREEIVGPLAQFQSTVFKMRDVRRLVKSINRSHTDPIDERQMLKTFDACWRSLEDAITAIEFRDEDEEYDDEEEQDTDELDEKEEEILVYLSENDGQEVPASEISRTIGENLTRTKHYITQLLDGEYVYDLLAMDQGDVYGIDDNGRVYLVEHDMID